MGFRVQVFGSSGFRVQVLGFRSKVLGKRVQGLGFRCSGLQGLGFRF